MNARQIIFVACLVMTCFLAVQADPAAPNAPTQENRAKRFLPYMGAYSSIGAYSYLAPYANGYSAVHYPVPVVSPYII